MPKANRPALDPFGFFPRLMRFLIGLAILTTLFGGGVNAAPKESELSESEIEARLADANGNLNAFIARVERSIRSRELSEAEAFLDRDAILNRATRQITFEGDDHVRALFCDSTKRAWDERGVMSDYAGSKFTFLRARTLGGRGGLLFRSSHRGNINYALFTVTETGPGDFHISDIFVVGLNEFLSDTLRRTWVNVAVGLMGKDAKGIAGVDPDYVSNIEAVAEMSRQLQSKKPEEVLKGMRRLPESVQKARTVLLMRIEAGEAVSKEEQEAAYAAWLAAYPDEMELPLKLARYYSNNRRWDDAERVIRNLIEKLGPDAMLKMELGTVIYRRDYDKSVAAAAGLSLR